MNLKKINGPGTCCECSFATFQILSDHFSLMQYLEYIAVVWTDQECIGP